MILVADGGSTKTDWRLIGPGGKVLAFQSKGLNPLFVSDRELIEELSKTPIPSHAQAIREVYFYGAGLATEESIQRFSQALASLFSTSVKLRLFDDLRAAALALFHGRDGIACILGTGSNSCLYINGEIVDKVPALGYTLGDEGSGANMGRSFINALFKRQLSPEITELICRENNIDTSTVIQKVYQEKFPNRYLASFTHIIIKYINHPEISSLVINAFEDFIAHNIRQYDQHERLEIGFVGSVAHYFQDLLRDVLRRNDLMAGPILQAPIDRLSAYHLEKYTHNKGSR